MKNNKEKISILRNYQKILRIKKTNLLNKISILKNKKNVLNDNINRINFCLLPQFYQKIIAKVNKEEVNENKHYILIILEAFNSNNIIENINHIYKKGDIVTFITDNKENKEIFAKISKKILINDIVTVDQDRYWNEFIFAKIIKKIKYLSLNLIKPAEIYVMYNDYESNLQSIKIHPFPQELKGDINCDRFTKSKKMIYLPTRKIWQNELFDSWETLKIRLYFLESDIMILLRKSLVLRENLKILDEKIDNLIKDDKVNKNIAISDELNILQG